MIIHTVYRPEESVDYLEEWLRYHANIGVKCFYLYDNGGSKDISYESDPFFKNKNNKTRYGIDIKYSPEEARNIEKNFIQKYNVVKINWQNKDNDGNILYMQQQSILDFSHRIKNGLCAFIDIDEFIVKRENFYPSRIFQRKMKHYSFYNSVADCHEYIPIDTKWWAPKAILDMSNFPDFSIEKNDTIHFERFDLPISKNIFNHYNYNGVTHEWLMQNINLVDSNWKYKNTTNWESCIERIDNPFE